jgi:hypothetical protein
MSEKKTYEVLIGFCIGSGVDVYPGDEVELTDKEAQPFMRAGRLRAVESRDPEVQNRDPGQAPGQPAKPVKVKRAAKK